MSENSSAAKTKKIELPSLMFVKGGTSTARHDEESEKRFLQSEADRDRADRERQLAAPTIDQAVQAGAPLMHERDLRGPQGASYVPVRYCNRAGEQYWKGCGDLVVMAADELMVIVVCPKCVLRQGVHVQDCQIQIRQTNVPFEFRPDAGRFFIFDDGNGQVRYRSAGTVVSSGPFTCPQCTYRARFDNNRLVED